MSVKRDMPLEMTAFPGAASPARDVISAETLISIDTQFRNNVASMISFTNALVAC
jgi:hypothetical protein